MDSNLECTNQDIDFKINENWSDSEILIYLAILDKLFGYYSRGQYQKQSKLQNNFVIHFDRRFGGDWVRIIGQCECRFGQWDHNQLQCQVNKSHLFLAVLRVLFLSLPITHLCINTMLFIALSCAFNLALICRPLAALEVSLQAWLEYW